MIVYHQDLFFQAPPVKIQRPLDDEIEHLSGLFMGQVILDDGIAAAGIDQMIKADAIDVFRLHQIQDRAYILEIVLIDGEAQTHALTYGPTIADTFHSLVESAFNAAEPVSYTHLQVGLISIGTLCAFFMMRTRRFS